MKERQYNKYVRDLSCGELVDAHRLCRPLFGVVDKVVHCRTIDTIIVALVDTLTFYLSEQPQGERQEFLALFRKHLIDEIERDVVGAEAQPEGRV